MFAVTTRKIKSGNLGDPELKPFTFSNTEEIISVSVVIDPNNLDIFYFITIKLPELQ